MKNLKKLISAVVALTLVVGSVAMAAPTFTDVADTAANAQAINTLAALDVIAGYEDGSFKPENKITRAEVSTMIVAALNRSADATGAKGATKFADANTDAKAWATGYINIGVQEGFISGYEDGTFKPDNNVTYAELCSMLVRIAGYGKFAEYLGGFPNGYISVADDKGITKNVSSAAGVAVTRGQVAQMIYNTLVNVPVVESTSMSFDAYGNLVPTLNIMDGKDNDYKTLLNAKHNAYYVEGYVNATSATDGTLELGEVEFTVQLTKNYNDSELVIDVKKGDTADDITVLAGKTDAEKYFKTYASAIIAIDEEGDATMIDFVASGKNRTVSYNTNLIDDENTDFANGLVSYYESKDASKSKEYELASDAELYVNGVKVTLDSTAFNTYVANNETGVVQYVDRYAADMKLDDEYDLIFVTYYGTAQITSVNAKIGRITLDTAIAGVGTSTITLDEEAKEEGELTWKILYNGEEIEIADLQEDDVISVAYDVADFATSKFYEIYVSRDTAEGKISKMDPETKTVTIAGTAYEFVGDYDTAVAGLGYDTYTVALDAFGRIYGVEMTESSKKIAIIENYTDGTGDGYQEITLYKPDGSTQKVDIEKDLLDAPAKTALKALVWNGTIKTGIENRVAEYKISNKTGRLSYINVIAADATVGDDSADPIEYVEFQADKESFGYNFKMSAATKIINAEKYEETEEYEDLKVASLSTLVDEAGYVAYGFDYNVATKKYGFVIITASDMGGYAYDTNFAVVTSAVSVEYDEDLDEEYKSFEAFIAESEEEVALKADYAFSTVLAIGDVIVYTVDEDGYIDDLDIVVAGSDLANNNTKYTPFFEAVIAADPTIVVPNAKWKTSWDMDDLGSKAEDSVQVLFGVVLDATKDGFKFGDILAKKTYLDQEADGTNGGCLDIEVDEATNVIICNLENTRGRYTKGVTADIIATAGYTKTDDPTYGEIVDWNANHDYVNFALVKAVDGVATDVIVFVGTKYNADDLI